MAITTQTAVIGCVLPAAALALVATLYIFSRRKRQDDVTNTTSNSNVTTDNNTNDSKLVTKTDNKDVTDGKSDVKKKLESEKVTEEVILCNDVKVTSQIPTTSENDVASKADVKEVTSQEVTSEIMVKDSVGQTKCENVILEELFQSAKASLEEAQVSDVTVNDVTVNQNDVPDEETLRAFMTSLMTRGDDNASPWSAEEVILNDDVTMVESSNLTLGGAGDAPDVAPPVEQISNNNNKRRDTHNKKKDTKSNKPDPKKEKPEKKEKKKPDPKKNDVKAKRAEPKVEPKPEVVCDKKEQEEQSTHQRSHSESISEVSSDSGNGTSLTERQSLPSPSSSAITCYQFEFPSRLCGKFVGKSGRNINQIKNASGCQITLLQHPYYNPEYQICTLDGTEDEIASALRLIKEKFPQNRFSDVSYEQFAVAPPEGTHPVISPDFMELHLISGIYNDVVVSGVVDASQIFVQQPTHPTFPSLEALNINMNTCYNQDPTAPTLPTPVEAGVICAAPYAGGWYRAQILAWQEGVTEVDVKFVDYGGYERLQLEQLKQIRSDFMTIPFQACECYLANIGPLEGETSISVEAGAVLEELCQASVLQCEIVQYDEVTKVPYVYLYKIGGNQTQFINRELVDRGLVRWLE